MPATRDKVFEVLDRHAEDLRALGVRRLALFGSTVRDEARSESDLDFVVELQENTFDAFMNVKLYLEDLFERPVDLVLRDSIKPRLRTRILQESVHVPGF